MRSRPQSDELYRALTRIFAVVIGIFGIVIIVVTLASGGGVAATGIWLGLLFTGLGAARLYLSMRTDDE